MWEEVYRTYAGEDDKWLEIGEQCSKSDYKSSLEIPHKESIENAMGEGSKAVAIKYGLNIEEIQANSEIILGLEDSLNQGDEIYVDITHSFRSLPLFVMNLLIYLRDVSPKKIKIAGIYYGMLEASRELKYAPVVNLSEVMNVNSWISGAYSFMEFGNAYKIASLIDSQTAVSEPKRISTPLIGFTEAKNLNHLSELENQVHKMQILKNTEGLPTIAKMVIDPVVGTFLKSVKLNEGKFKHSDFQYQLAIWQNNNHNYAAAYISLNEAILTRACELCKFDSSDFNERENMKVVFRWARGVPGMEAKLKELALLEYVQSYADRSTMKYYADLYHKVSKNRNAIAHSIKDGHGSVINTVKNMIRDLDTFIKY
jgi:CRISPR-associated Csx2 family protein